MRSLALFVVVLFQTFTATSAFAATCTAYGCSACGTCTAYGCPSCDGGNSDGTCTAYGCSSCGTCTAYGCPPCELSAHLPVKFPILLDRTVNETVIETVK